MMLPCVDLWHGLLLRGREKSRSQRFLFNNEPFSLSERTREFRVFPFLCTSEFRFFSGSVSVEETRELYTRKRANDNSNGREGKTNFISIWTESIREEPRFLTSPQAHPCIEKNLLVRLLFYGQIKYFRQERLMFLRSKPEIRSTAIENVAEHLAKLPGWLELLL